MKLRHFLPVIAMAFPFVSHAESEFSYDYLELSTTYATIEVEGSNDDISANLFAVKFSKELFFQVFTTVDVQYLYADNKIDFESDSLSFESESYRYNLEIGRYFELHKRVNAVLSARHTRTHTESKIIVSDPDFGDFKGTYKDVNLNYSIDAGLRIHLDDAKRFELIPNIITRFDAEDDTDTALELGFGYTPMTNLQLVATYLTEPSDTENHQFSLGGRWFY